MRFYLTLPYLTFLTRSWRPTGAGHIDEPPLPPSTVPRCGGQRRGNRHVNRGKDTGGNQFGLTMLTLIIYYK